MYKQWNGCLTILHTFSKTIISAGTFDNVTGVSFGLRIYDYDCVYYHSTCHNDWNFWHMVVLPNLYAKVF
jgi:hypothetical protein